ncbi:Cellulose synthase catalytic subunit [UDP-forming] [Polaromonas vacuolata]|uniref:Cellulose synthase catalytic subunit [UDP-forming] n=1 Tax=Polaromonas vacuolata TaxID=37448 RepID=A0A6H2H9F7_9BURK|nr:cellulose synthase catalytic subunit [Polaromonas vacuolata]QJC56511.1 Cellulose synthase catalytic subunit [UDP-forming] [Polaromonas vacuolata]
MPELVLYLSIAAAAITSLAMFWLSPQCRQARLGVLLVMAWVFGVYFVWRLGQTVLWGGFSFAALYTQFFVLVELLWLAEMVHDCHFYTYASRPLVQGISRALRQSSIDVVIASYNEPRDILEKTLLCALHLDWSAPIKIYVIDDGKRQWLAELCYKLGINYLSRPDNLNAKAGNINHALDYLHGDFALLLDADFLVAPFAIEKLIAPMVDAQVAVVQSPHDFYNPDPIQRSLGLESLSPTDQIHFFNDTLRMRDNGGAAFFCGSSGLIRLKALKEISGFPTDSITEDIFVSLKLKSQGYLSVTIKEAVATGLNPQSINDFFAQRKRWGEGAIQMNSCIWGSTQSWLRNLGVINRLQFFPVYWLISYPVRLISLLVPQACLLLGWQPLVNAPINQLLAAQGGVLILILAFNQWISRSHSQLLLSQIWHDVLALRLTFYFLFRLIKPNDKLVFSVTPKGSDAVHLAEASASSAAAQNPNTATPPRYFDVLVLSLLILTFACLALGVVNLNDAQSTAQSGVYAVSLFWALINFARIWFVYASLRREKAVRLEELQAPVRIMSDLWIDGLPANAVGEFQVSESSLSSTNENQVIAHRDLALLHNGTQRHIGRTNDQGKILFHTLKCRGLWLSRLTVASLEVGLERLNGGYKSAQAVAQTIKASFT